ncbi:MAG TPA: hypothetical protein VLG71_00190 [Candidatus Limnocylindria bacterium]|nr:hypothetical protein [Candidatus Limnocylindria bacterium]
MIVLLLGTFLAGCLNAATAQVSPVSSSQNGNFLMVPASPLVRPRLSSWGSDHKVAGELKGACAQQISPLSVGMKQSQEESVSIPGLRRIIDMSQKDRRSYMTEVMSKWCLFEKCRAAMYEFHTNRGKKFSDDENNILQRALHYSVLRLSIQDDLIKMARSRKHISPLQNDDIVYFLSLIPADLKVDQLWLALTLYEDSRANPARTYWQRARDKFTHALAPKRVQLNQPVRIH